LESGRGFGQEKILKKVILNKIYFVNIEIPGKRGT